MTPATTGFIHESVKVSDIFTDSSTQDLSLLVMKLHPSAHIMLGLPWLCSTNPTTDWVMLSLTFKTGPRLVLPSVTLARACTVAALCHKDIISYLSPIFDSISELCMSAGLSLPTKVVLITLPTSSVKLGLFLSNVAPPSALLLSPNTVSSCQSCCTHGTHCHPGLLRRSPRTI